MSIALPLFVILSFLLFVLYLWERTKHVQQKKYLARESRKLERTNQITGAILRNVHAYVLLIDKNLTVLKTNYYQKTNTQKDSETKRVGDLLRCRHALSSKGGCGTSEYCPVCPIRGTINKAFQQKRGFTDLEANLSLALSEYDTMAFEGLISGSYFLIDEEENMVITVHDVTRQKQLERELRQLKAAEAS